LIERFERFLLQNQDCYRVTDCCRNSETLPNHHLLAHAGIGNKDPSKTGKGLAMYDKFQSELLTDFIKKLADTPENGGTMLDNTLIYYGTSNSRTHVNNDYPLLLCGGSNLGLKHGKFHMLGDRKMPLSNLYVTLLNALDVPTEKFSDSTGKLEVIV